MKQLIASILGVAAEDITTFGLIFGLIGTAVFISIPLFWLKETFSWIPEAIGKRKEKKKETQRKSAAVQSLREEDEARFRAYQAGKRIDTSKLLDYAEFDSVFDLPNDPELIKRLMKFLEHTGDYRRGFLCRDFLVRYHDTAELFPAYVEDLLAGQYCKKNVPHAIHYLERINTGEAHYQLYRLYSDSTLQKHSLFHAADHLSIAWLLNDKDAKHSLNVLNQQAANGDGEAAYILSQFFTRLIMSSQSENSADANEIYSMLWLMIAKEDGFAEAEKLYNDVINEQDLAEQAEKSIEIVDAFPYSNNDAVQEDIIDHLMTAAFLGHPKTLQFWGIILGYKKSPYYNPSLGEACTRIAERKKQDDNSYKPVFL